LLNTIKDDIIAVISEHVHLDTGKMRIRLAQKTGHSRLEAYVSIVGPCRAPRECKPGQSRS
jgi:septum formation topological specificity factor MinE